MHKNVHLELLSVESLESFKVHSILPLPFLVQDVDYGPQDVVQQGLRLLIVI